MAPAPANPSRDQVYLRSRGVSDAAIEEAKAVGALRYAPDGVVFRGRDHASEPRGGTSWMAGR